VAVTPSVGVGELDRDEESVHAWRVALAAGCEGNGVCVMRSKSGAYVYQLPY
jgi:hypothetical protein